MAPKVKLTRIPPEPDIMRFRGYLVYIYNTRSPMARNIEEYLVLHGAIVRKVEFTSDCIPDDSYEHNLIIIEDEQINLRFKCKENLSKFNILRITAFLKEYGLTHQDIYDWLARHNSPKFGLDAWEKYYYDKINRIRMRMEQ